MILGLGEQKYKMSFIYVWDRKNVEGMSKKNTVATWKEVWLDKFRTFWASNRKIPLIVKYRMSKDSPGYSDSRKIKQ